tara:strand:- start:804 stop:1829 length:1026 start_codon:yes stop_codon:yes gene_type:complete
MVSSKPVFSSLNVAIVGSGLMGFWHTYYALRSGVTIVAIIDTDVNSAKRLVKKTQGAQAFESITAMLAKVTPDVLHICTPIQSHHNLAKQAINAGIHVLLEKPLFATAEETLELTHLAQSKSLLLCPVHQFCFQKAMHQVSSELKRLDRPLRIDFEIASAGSEALGNPSEVIKDILPHPLSILRQLWPKQPFESDKWVIQQYGDSELVIIGRYNKILLNLHISMKARPTRCEFSLQTTTGTLHVNLFHDYLIKEAGNTSKFHKITQPLALGFNVFFTSAINLIRRVVTRQPAYPGLQTLIQHFYLAVQGREVTPVAIQDAIDIAIARDDIIKKMNASEIRV